MLILFWFFSKIIIRLAVSRQILREHIGDHLCAWIPEQKSFTKHYIPLKQPQNQTQDLAINPVKIL